MPIDRKVRKTRISPATVRYRVLVTSDECPPKTLESRQRQHLFLQWLADNQTLLECGYSVPDRIVIAHNGVCWQAEAEAEVEEPDSL